MTDKATAETSEPAALLDTKAVARAALGAVALLTILLVAFAWPTSELKPRSLPIAVTAPTPEGVAAVEAALAEALGEDGADVVEVADRDAAVAAIEDRETYGAIVIGPNETEILTASAASPLVAQLLGQAAQGMSAEQDSPPTSVTDIVSTADGDPRGAVFGAGALPLALGGLLVGALSSLLLPRIRDRMATTLLASAGAGLALTGVLQGLLGALNGNYWANASVIALGVLAVALLTIGMYRQLDRPGIAIVAVLVMLIGNPLSGVASAPELLPLGWLGQLLPPGAAGTALRGTAYFDGAGIGTALVVLACCAGIGLLLALVPRRHLPRQADHQSPSADA